MSITKTIRIVGALLLLGIGQATWAQSANRWVYLGQATVDSQRDYDRIVVGRTSGRFSNIQIRVAGGPIEFQRVVVHYGNNTSEEVTLRDRIPAGGQTRAIDLSGGDRAISSVDFWYSRANWSAGARPRVSLYGADLNQVADRPTQQRPGPWVYLGQSNVDSRLDHDRIVVGRARANGRFQSIQIRVQGAPIEFQRVIVQYANGTTEELTLRDRIPSGSQTRAIDLSGGERAISYVDFWYSPGNSRARYQPRVSLYGR